MYINKENALTITRTYKNKYGDIIKYELDNGEKVDTETLISLARQGAINGVNQNVDTSQLPEEIKFANLTNLPKL